MENVTGGTEKYLDEKLALARDNTLRETPTLAVVLDVSGFGKSDRVKEWAEKNNLSYKYLNAPMLKVNTFLSKKNVVSATNAWDKIKFGVNSFFNAEYEKYLFTPNDIEELSKENQVVIIDMYDYAKLEIRNELMKLITKGEIVDKKEKPNGYIKKLRNILMIVVVTNNEKPNDVEDYTQEELNIFDAHQNV